MNGWKRSLLMAIAIGAAGLGCGKLKGNPNEGTPVDYNSETANAAGEQMSGMDEGSSGGGLALFTPVKGNKRWIDQFLDTLVPSAYGASCTASGSWTCTTTVPAGAPAGTMSALLGDFSAMCSVGGITLTGKTNIDFSTTNCRIPTANDFLIRLPDYTFTRNGLSLHVGATTNGGQKLTRTGLTTFDFSVLGVERKATQADGGTLFDIQTSTTSPIHVSGLTRATRTWNGGALVVEHKLAKFTTTLVPNNLAWSAGCTCATSGSLDGTNTGTRTNSFTVTMGSTCGAATLSGTEADGGTLNASVQIEHCHLP